jgi:hypothetical protein
MSNIEKESAFLEILRSVGDLAVIAGGLILAAVSLGMADTP